MARKRYGDVEILNLLREIELSLGSGSDVATACRSAGVSDATYYNWRKKYGGMGKSQPVSTQEALRKMGIMSASTAHYEEKFSMLNGS